MGTDPETGNTDLDARPSAGQALLRAALGSVVLALSIGLGSGVATVLAEAVGLPVLAVRVLSALVVTVVAVPAVLWLRRRRDGGGLHAIGVTGLAVDLRGLALGAGVTIAAGCVVVGAAGAAGLVSSGTPDLGPLMLFLVINTVVALGYEALPEELAMRGYVWTSLAERWRDLIATTMTTGLFLLVPSGAIAVHAAITAIAGGAPRWAFMPEGEDPVVYFMFLALVSIVAVGARRATPQATVGTCVGFHLAMLTVNRIVLTGQADDAVWPMALQGEAAFLVLPVYLVVARLAFDALHARHRTRGTLVTAGP